MNGFLNKCDIELQVIYANYLSVQSGKKGRLASVHHVLQGTGRLSVLLKFAKDVQAISNLGFKVTDIKDGHTAQGSLKLADLEVIAKHDHTLSLSVGKAGHTMLNTSVPNINVSGSGQVWQFNSGTNQFSGLTGEGVVVGIIDTGIDWTHPVFLATDSPKTTRIKRIWDPGRDPHGSAQSPQAQYMEGSERYGVEYTDTMINQVLQGDADASTIKHKDCGGHGTHVASIAAGDGRAPKPGESNSTYKYIGVAPKADIVVVKVLDLFKFLPETEPEPGDANGTYILYDQMFKDAVTYIFKVAELDLGNKPVVINYSIASSMVAHDGFTELEEWLTQKFGAADSKGLFVCAAGNDRGKHTHAEATIQPNGEINIPFELIDARSNKKSYDNCKNEVDKVNAYISMWYAQPTGTVLPYLTLPGRSEAAGLGVSATIQHGYFGNNNQYHHTFIHSTKTFTKPPTAGNPAKSVTRNSIYLRLSPTIRGDFCESIYNIRITGPPGTKIYIWVYKSGRGYGLIYDNESMAGLQVRNSHLIGRPGGANNILTVASYNDSNGNISSFSSPGPLMDYSTDGIPYINKPDITAPGSDSRQIGETSITEDFSFPIIENIMAAESTHTNPPASSPCLQQDTPHNYAGYSGTSMASPHIAGVAALLLEKNNDLTTSQLINIIKTNIQTGSNLGPNDWGAGKVDAKRAADSTPVAAP